MAERQAAWAASGVHDETRGDEATDRVDGRHLKPERGGEVTGLTLVQGARLIGPCRLEVAVSQHARDITAPDLSETEFPPIQPPGGASEDGADGLETAGLDGEVARHTQLAEADT
jgi:hypothetical protein